MKKKTLKKLKKIYEDCKKDISNKDSIKMHKRNMGQLKHCIVTKGNFSFCYPRKLDKDKKKGKKKKKERKKRKKKGKKRKKERKKKRQKKDSLEERESEKSVDSVKERERELLREREIY